MASVTTLTPRQIRMRHRGLSASDIAALSGCVHGKGPIHVYQEKVNPPRQYDDEPASQDQMRGVYLELGIRPWYKHLRGAQEILDGRTYTHPDHPGSGDTPAFMATPDGIATFQDGTTVAVEIKAPRFNRVREWCPSGNFPDDIEIPPYVIPQVAWQAFVLGVQAVDVAVLLGDELRILTYNQDASFAEDLRLLAERFWRDYVLPRRPPPPDASVSFTEWLRARHPRSTQGSYTVADKPTVQWALEYVRCQEAIKEASARQREARNHLEAAIGDNEGLDCGAYGKITYRNAKDASVIDYPAIVHEAGIDAALIRKHTHTKQGSRRFLPRLKDAQ